MKTICFYLGSFIAELSLAKSAQRNTMGKTNWKPMETRKSGYDVAYTGAPTARTPTKCKPMSNVGLFWGESVFGHLRLVKGLLID